MAFPGAFSAGTPQTGSGSDVFTLDGPPLAGNYQIAIITSAGGSETMSAPSGWVMRADIQVTSAVSPDRGGTQHVWVLSQTTPTTATQTFTKAGGTPSGERRWAGIRISWASVTSATYLSATPSLAAIESNETTTHTTSAVTPPASIDTKIVAIAAIDIGPSNTSLTITQPGSPWSSIVNYKSASASEGQLISVSERQVAGTASPTAITASFTTASVEDAFLMPIVLRGTSSAVPPTVGAGTDVASHPASTTFSRTATENNNGFTITARAWTIVSGPTGAGTTIGTAAALSWTPAAPAGIGTYVLRYSATSSGGTGTDDMQIVVVGKPVNASAAAGNVVVAGLAASVTLIPAVRVPVPAGEVVVEGVPVSLTKYAYLPAPAAVVVGGQAVNVAHLVPVDGVAEIAVAGLAIGVSRRLRAGQIEVAGLEIQVAYGSDGPGGQTGVIAFPPSATSRFIVQSVLDGKFVHWDLPIVNPTVSYVLSGPTTISGVLDPEDPEIRNLIESRKLDAWACWVHLEIDGIVRASGILQPVNVDESPLTIEVTGPSGYVQGIPYMGELSAIAIDPADVVRAIWAHVQSYPDGQLGVTVNGTTPVRIGEPEPEEGKEYAEGERPSGPYKLSWWEGPDCGREIDSLAQEAPFDYVERCAWNADKTAVVHWIDLAYPRIGTRREDLRFADGENIIGAVPVEETDDLYASQVVMFGKGEGRDTIRGYAGRPMGGRLRRVAVIQDATIESSSRASAVAAVELERRQGLIDVTDIEVEARHTNAQFGTYAVGDDILVDVEVPWLGRIRQFERILSITYSPDGETVRLQLRRAEAFRYGGTT